MATQPSFTDQLKEVLAEYYAKQERLSKHTPGGQDHPQERHGDRAGAGGGEPGSSSSGPKAAASGPSAGPKSADSNVRPGGSLTPPPDTPVPQGEAPDLIKKMTNEGYAKYGARINHVMEVAGEGQMSAEPKIDKKTGERIPGRIGIDTMGEYGVWEGDEFKGYRKDRIQLHTDMIRAEMERQQQENDGREPKNEKQAIIMAGLPGSGKTYTLKSQLGDKFDLRDYAVINADDLKAQIHAFGSPTDPTGGDLTVGEMSSLMHEESSYLSKVWRKAMMRQGTNIALDMTAANKDKTLKDIQALKDAGYTVHIVHVDVEVDEAIASALVRAGEGSPVPGKLGRMVPPQFIESMQQENGTDAISNAFNEYAAAANGSAHWYRNWPLSGRSQKRPPELVWSREAIPEQLPLGHTPEPTQPYDQGQLESDIWEESRIAASILAAIGARR